MKKTYYCVMSEFYDDGTVKACMLYSNREEKPEGGFMSTPIADCYKDWYETKAAAKMALIKIRKLAEKARMEA